MIGLTIYLIGCMLALYCIYLDNKRADSTKVSLLSGLLFALMSWITVLVIALHNLHTPAWYKKLNEKFKGEKK